MPQRFPSVRAFFLPGRYPDAWTLTRTRFGTAAMAEGSIEKPENQIQSRFLSDLPSF